MRNLNIDGKWWLEFNFEDILHVCRGENMSVKVKKIENNRVFIIPEEIKPTDGEYDVFQGRSGSIVFSPKKTNPFKDKDFINNHDFTQCEEFVIKSKGEEEID